MKTIKVTTITILLITMMVGAVEMMEKHDRAMQQAYEKYEVCFLHTYGMTPSTWYSTVSEKLPECKD